MNNFLAQPVSRHPLQALPPELAPEEVTQHKLTRLLELRAVINAMRHEREARDPLLRWVTSRDNR